MTEDELKAVWARWAHRNDVDADMDTIGLLASQLVVDRLMFTGEPIEFADEVVKIMELHPGCFVHAGLIHLHELAQDDEGIMRERSLFAQAIEDYHMRRSLDGVEPVMDLTGV